MDKLITSGLDLHEYFIECSRPSKVQRTKNIVYEGIYVDTKVRKEILTGVDQARIEK